MVSCKHKPADYLQTSRTPVPTPAAKEIGSVGMAGPAASLASLQCTWHPARAASPSPLALGGALHHHILVQTAVGRWLGQHRSCRGQWGRCHFWTSCSILQIVKIYLSSDYLVVNDIWHFYHGLIILLLLYIIFFNNPGKGLWVWECNSCNTCLFSF